MEKTKQPKTVVNAMSFIDYVYDNTDETDLFEFSEDITALRLAIAQNPKELETALKKLEVKIRTHFVENEICPDCGTPLEWENDSRYDTYVPYGGDFIKESDGGSMVCPNCGFKIY